MTLVMKTKLSNILPTKAWKWVFHKNPNENHETNTRYCGRGLLNEIFPLQMTDILSLG